MFFRKCWVLLSASTLLVLFGLSGIYLLLTNGHTRYVHFLAFEGNWSRAWRFVASLPGRFEHPLIRWGFLSPGLVEADVGEGVRMMMDPQDYVTRTILRRGSWESEEWKWIRDRVRPSGVFVDVGAHHGSYTLRIARLLDRGGMVVAIEPNPESVARLHANIRLNGLANVVVHPVACGDRDGQVRLHLASERNTGMTSLAAETAAGSGPGGAARSLEVPMRTLDQLTAALPERQIFAIKVDTEGAETMVLRGAPETIRKHRPAVVVETIPRQLEAMGSSLEELESLLQSYGYEKTAATATNALWEPRRHE